VTEMPQYAVCSSWDEPCAYHVSSQLTALSAYLTGGGSVLVMSAEGGDGKQGSNIGDFTSEFGVTINGDIVLRTVFYKYLHPKEAFVSRGCLSKPFGAAVTRVQVWPVGEEEVGGAPFHHPLASAEHAAAVALRYAGCPLASPLRRPAPAVRLPL
jgi:hypothetical protein